jgi:DNA-binding NarL/FixJ family response regulator
MKRPRVLLADDHAIVIEGLRRILEPGFEIVGEAADGRALVAAAEKLRPDIIVADVSMPLLNGIEAARQIRKIDRKVKIVFLTMHSDVTYAAEALRAGGSAYVLKSNAGVRLVEAIREALSGRIFVSPSIDREAVLAQMERVGREDELPSAFTPRQREVLQLIAEGRTSKQMAEVLHVSPRTIDFHRYRIMKALALSTTAELVQYAVMHGIASA